MSVAQEADRRALALLHDPNLPTVVARLVAARRAAWADALAQGRNLTPEAWASALEALGEAVQQADPTLVAHALALPWPGEEAPAAGPGGKEAYRPTLLVYDPTLTTAPPVYEVVTSSPLRTKPLPTQTAAPARTAAPTQTAAPARTTAPTQTAAPTEEAYPEMDPEEGDPAPDPTEAPATASRGVWGYVAATVVIVAAAGGAYVWHRKATGGVDALRF